MKTNNPAIEETLNLISVLHEGQTDRAGLPYRYHPLAVMNTLPRNSSHERKLMALLHDVVEDCAEKIAGILGIEAVDVTPEVTVGYLRSLGYCKRVTDGVMMLTRTPGTTYKDEIRHIVASSNIDVMWVKACDNTQNLSEERIALLPVDEQVRVREMGIKRYVPSRDFLLRTITAAHPRTFVYTNWLGETSERTVEPKSLRLGSTEYHMEQQWLLLAYDTQRKADREFAVGDISYDAPISPEISFV